MTSHGAFTVSVPKEGQQWARGGVGRASCLFCFFLDLGACFLAC